MAWQVDNAHSHIQFYVRHLMFSKVRGFFEKFEAVIGYDEDSPENSTIVVAIDTSSANTRDAQRDSHLQAPDFFNVTEFPTATFKSTRIRQTGKTTGKVFGNLTIRNTTKQVVLDARRLGTSAQPRGVSRTLFGATASIDRRDWGLVWNKGLDTGGALAGWQVQLDIRIQLEKLPDDQTDAAP